MTEDHRAVWDRITAVVVTYNSAAVIADCLKSLAAAKEIIVVDNASTDSTCEIVQRTTPGANIIRNADNRGFGAAVNQGLAEAKTEFGFYFSPDSVLAEGAMEDLAAAADANPNVAIFGPYLKRPNGDQELYVMGPGETRHVALDTQPAGNFCTWFVMGGFFLCRISAWQHVGGFDERIFLYGEDVDLSLRTTAAGYGMMIVPGAEVVHAGGQSSKINWTVKWRKDWHQTWSRLYVMAKHGDAEQARREARDIRNRHLWKTLLYAILLRPDRVRGNWAKASGAGAFLANRPSH